MAFPSQFQLISVDEPYEGEVIHAFKGFEPLSKEEHAQLAYQMSKIVFHSTHPYKNFVQFFERMAEMDVEGSEKKPKLFTAPDSRTIDGEIEWPGIWMRYGTYEKVRGAPTAPVDALSPVDLGWPTMARTAGGHINWEDLPQSWRTSQMQVAVEQWNLFMTLFARAGTAAVHPFAAGGAILGDWLSKLLTKNDFYIVLSVSPWTASVKGERTPETDDCLRIWRFGGDGQTHVGWSTLVTALKNGNFSDEEKKA